MAITISRKQLFERVWQQPMTHIAKEFGVSDVGLRKMCKRHDIPTPPAGYWAKLAHNKPVAAAKLKNRDDDHAICIWRGTSGDEPDTIAKARAEALAALGNAPAAAGDNAIVDRTLAMLRSAKPRADGLVRARGAKFIQVAVRPQTLQRAEQLLRQLVGSGEAAGFELKRGVDAMSWHCGGESVAFEVTEAADQVEHEATDKELAALAEWQREREDTHKRYGYWSSYGEPKIPKWEQRYNGRLAVRLENVRIKSDQDPWGQPIRGTFADSRTRDVARMIPSIVAAIATTAAAKRNNAAYDERRRIAEEAAKQRWQEEERRRYEWQRAGKILDELFEIERQADGLRLWLDRLRGRGPGLPRTDKLVALVERRLDQLQQQLSNEALERRLERERMFAEAD
jgi:hypothetical protein